MKFNTTRRKKRKVLEKNINSELQLLRKTNSLTKKIHTYKLQAPKVIFDSGWLGSTIQTEPNIFPDVDPNLYAVASGFETQAIEGELVPIKLSYNLVTDVNIREDQIGLIKPIIMFSQNPDLELRGVRPFQPYEYSSEDYHQIKGDGQLIYQGFFPGKTSWEQTELDLGSFDIDLTSRWYKGTIKVNSVGDIWEVRNGLINSIQTWYNITESPVTGDPDWYHFIVPAIDSLSAISVTGTGEREISIIIDDGGGSSHQEITSTLNVSTTANIFDTAGFRTGVTKIIFSTGTIYKNDVFQGSVGSLGYVVTVKGTLWDESTFRPGDKTGDVIADSLVSFSVERAYIGSENNFTYRIWYSDKRAIPFRLSDNDELMSIPNESDYETSTLPYTQITVKVNESNDYPEVEQDFGVEDLTASTQEFLWAEIDNDIYRLFLRGIAFFWMPATKEGSTPETFVDETYSPSGATYLKDSENRDDKDMPLYSAEVPDIYYRFYVSMQLPYNHKIDRETKREQ